MIKHIVMWKLKEEVNGKTKSEVSREIKEKLEALKGVIKEIVSIEVGTNAIPSNQAYDLCLNSVFNTVEDLEVYQKHPEHQKVVGLITEARVERVVVDYEI